MFIICWGGLEFGFGVEIDSLISIQKYLQIHDIKTRNISLCIAIHFVTHLHIVSQMVQKHLGQSV